MPPYRAVFYDWDGTLVTQDGLIGRLHNQVRSDYGFPPFNSRDPALFAHQSTRDLYAQVFGDKAQGAMEHFYTLYARHHLDALRVFEDVLGFFKAASSLPFGIVSNKSHAYLVKEISHLGWNHRFPVVVGAGRAARDKPSPDPLFLAVSMAGIEKDDMKSVLYIGDTEADLLSARDAGCDVALLARGRDVASLVETYRPAYVCDDLSALATILEKTHFLSH